MPGYLFLAEDRPIEWGDIIHDKLRFPHCGKPLKGLTGPLRIPSRLVVKIHEDEVDGKFDETGATKKANREKLAKQFAKGLEFRVNDGPFWGHVCTSDGITAHDRIAALVSLFGRLVKAEFEPTQLEAA